MAIQTNTGTDIKEAFIRAFAPEAPNGQPIAPAVKESAAAALQALQFPHKKNEAWKYTPVQPLVSKAYIPAEATEPEDISPFLIPGLEADVLVYINGKFSSAHSQIQHNKQLCIESLRQLSSQGKAVVEAHFGKLLNKDDIFAALNTAYAKDGTLVYVPKGTVAAVPIHIIQLTLPGQAACSLQHRNLFVVEPLAEAKVVESFYSLSTVPSLRNAGTEIFVGENAGLEYVKLQLEQHTASQIDHTEVSQARHSRFSIFTITLNGDTVRNDLQIHLDGTETETHLMGIYLLSGKQHVDNYTQILHKQPHCYSNELYKGIVADQATAAFSGKIHVFQQAQKTNAFQSNRNILLSKSANAYTRPQLEIYADDVKCSHGATTGKLEEDAMFYLRSRGIPEKQARKMLIHAFAGEVVEQISLEAVRTYLESLIASRYE